MSVKTYQISMLLLIIYTFLSVILSPVKVVNNINITAADSSIIGSDNSKSNYSITEIPLEYVDYQSASYTDKLMYIQKRLEDNGLVPSEVDDMIKIFHLESCTNTSSQSCLSSDLLPIVTVYHCTDNYGNYSTVEIKTVSGANIQAYCEDYGLTTTGSEQSIGLAQILVSTWIGNQCNGNPRDYIWYQQVDCAVKIYRSYGITQWSSHVLMQEYEKYVK